jgi:ribose transport system permease protein
LRQPEAPVGSAGAAAVSPRPSLARNSPFTALIQSREFSVVIVLVVLCIAMIFTDARETFYSGRNIQNILRQVALLSVFAIGETVVIITAGIDLSLGSMIAFTGMVLALFVTKLAVSLVAVPAILIAILLTLLVALAIGAIHASLIHKLNLPPFVVTLASLLILRSQSLIVNKQLPISLQEFPGLLYLANGTLFDGTPFALPMPIVILAVVAVLMSVALNRLRIGRYIYSIGSNEQATGLSGVNVYKVKLFAYGTSAVLGGLAGILWAAYGAQGDPQAASGYELDAVAASVVGGANLMGGQGSVMGTILGAMLLQVIFSAINLKLSSPDIWRGTVVGGVLLFAVLVTALQQKRARR